MEHTISPQTSLRLRVFAGPNGSGKSTVIKSVEKAIVNGKPIFLGIYVNADDIAVALKKSTFNFQNYEILCGKKDVINFARSSGLLSDDFTEISLDHCFDFQETKVVLNEPEVAERLAQIIARFLREKLLEAKKRFSFETVFSHESNLDIMRRAAEQGYKVYFYFVSTEDPVINKYRVALRVRKKGHPVPVDKISSRYYRSLELVKRANEIVYQAFFFDNSINNAPYRLVGHFKKVGVEQVWDEMEELETAQWFKKYCR